MNLKKKILLSLLTIAIGLTSTNVYAQSNNKNQDNKNKQEFSQAMSVIASSLNLLNRYFVDTINMKRVTRIGIDAMLGSLDPYTEYFSKEDASKLKLMTTGEYGGIGAIITQTPDSIVFINEPMFGMPADLAGLKAGDRFLQIDTANVRKATSQEVSDKLKGIPGTIVQLLIKRPGVDKPITFKIKRERVVMSPVPYYGILSNGIGYISLTSFTNQASQKVRDALEDLQKQHIKGLILDLRDNGGGLIDQAIDIVSLFVPNGSKVVTTKGRNSSESMTYKTTSDPIALNLPLAILVNGNTASASEIVSGSLQDMDRAVIIGEKSFGKGLVQATMRLPYDGILKLTTAKYYIPSGRCIQKINYHDLRAGKGEHILPDSLTAVFHTADGRIVHDAGGIMPDIIAKRDSLPTMIYYLMINNDVFNWITDYTLKHKTIAKPLQFSITDQDYKDFCKYIKGKKIEYDRQSGKVLQQLEKIAKIEGYYNKAQKTFAQLEKDLEPSLDTDLHNLKKQIIDYLNTAIITRYYYRKGALQVQVPQDKVIQKAISILSNKQEYNSILQPQKGKK